MGRLIAILGNSGAGKTTLVRQLCSLEGFIPALEQHDERPYQRAFVQAVGIEKQYFALANQVDYLLLRAEQELAIRESALDGVMDGGLEMDFFIFTRLFLQKGYLDQAGFDICERMYRLLRHTLPAPDLIIFLDTPLLLVKQRFAERERTIEVARLADLEMLHALLEEWRYTWTGCPVLTLDAGIEDPGFVLASQRIIREFRSLYSPSCFSKGQSGVLT